MPGRETARLKEATRAAIALCGGADRLSEDHGFPSPQAIRRWYSDDEKHEDVMIPACWIGALPIAARALIVAAFVPETHVLVELPTTEGDALEVIDATLASAREHAEAATAALAMRHVGALTQSHTATARKESGEAVRAAVIMHRAVCALDDDARRERVIAGPKLRSVG